MGPKPNLHMTMHSKCVCVWHPGIIFVFLNVWDHIHYESLRGLKMQYVVVRLIGKASLQTN